MAVDLRQVAQLSGVSVSTASRALTGSSRVSDQTATRVRAAAATLGYRPNASARALRGARSQFIGLVVTNLVNTSLQAIAEVARREFARCGYQLMLSITDGDPVQERAALRILVDYNAAGVIVVAPRRPTALIVASHEACYGVLPALREHPVSVPGDLSVICYEDSPLARWWHPAVTVIDNNAREMGELAARLLLRRLDPADGDRARFSEFRVGTRIIERDSCRPPRP